VDRIIATNILNQARRAVNAPAATTVDPIAELLRIIGPR
jgi:hypothetical protein